MQGANRSPRSTQLSMTQRPNPEPLPRLQSFEGLPSANLAPRHTTNPPVPCLSRSSRTAPPGGRLWHGFAVRRPRVGRGGLGLTCGRTRVERVLATDRPKQGLPLMDRKGMKRKSAAAPFFTERSLATFLAVSDRTIRNWIRKGELPSYKLGAARRIDPADVEDFLAQRRDADA